MLKWNIPTEGDITYDTTAITRSTSSTGTFTEIARQSISDNTYFDKDGTTSNWYKIQFLDTVNSKSSDLSSAIQGGAITLYCSIDDVRTVSGLNSSDVTDSTLYEIMKLVTIPSINKDIGVRIIREKVKWIDDVRQNDIDSSNTTYYVRNWENYYLGDFDNDGDVDTSDVVVHRVNSSDVEDTLTVSSITANDGKIVVSTAPASSDDLYLSYVYTPVSVSDPDRSIRLAAANLTAAYAFLRINAKKLPSFSIGKLRIAKQSEGFKLFYDAYEEIINKIRTRPLQKGKHKPIDEVIKAGF